MSEPVDDADGVDLEGEKLKLLKRFAMQLGEHFDSARINVTYSADGVTHSLSAGSGDWYAQYGATKLWVKSQENGVGEVEENDD